MRDRLPETVLSHSGVAKALGDAGAWAVGIIFAETVRFAPAFGWLTELRLLVIIGGVAAVQIAVGAASGLYRNHWRFGSFDELAALTQAAALTLLVALAVDLAVRARPIPVVVPFSAAAAALLTMMAERYGWRVFEQRRLRPSRSERRMLILGAGNGAIQLLHSLLRNPSAKYLPVALLDDDPTKRNLRIMGVRVVGNRTSIGQAAQSYHADMLVIAVPSAESELVREATDLATAAGLDVRVLPAAHELIDGRVTVGDIRMPTISDLLGRRQVQTDIDAIASYLSGRRVLVTGAGGSIGSELCRQLSKLGPAELVMLDRDESALHDVQLSLDGRGLLDSPDLVLVDIRDAERLAEVFTDRQPQVVFHAAALKHLPLLEAHPGEAVKSNVWGTLNVLQAAKAADVERFVNISTDKAADPVSALGYSKRIAERLTAHIAGISSGTYLSVRFGNVLGSRGSVLGAFRAQIERGGPVSVTHPQITRYFMTIEEAVQLVIQAAAVGRAGEALVLDMGEPVRIADVAARLIRESGRRVDIAYTGLRPGEKLCEDLFGRAERAGSRPAHPLISHVPVPPLEDKLVVDMQASGPQRIVLQGLAATAHFGVEPAPPPDDWPPLSVGLISPHIDFADEVVDF